MSGEMGKCEHCGREFEKQCVHHRFCSDICRKNAYKKKMYKSTAPKPARRPLPPVMTIDEMVARARQEHCTYGKLQQKLRYEMETGRKHTGRSW